MIEIFEGRIGGGKTYTAVERIAERLAVGGTVYTNIETNWQGMTRLVAYRFGCYCEQDQLLKLPDDVYGWHESIKWGTIDSQVLVIIDEAHLWYNARDWAKTQSGHKEMLRFLTQSRKANVDVIFITQAISNLDKQFRALAQFVWSLRDLGRAKGFISALFGGFIFYVARDYDGIVMQSGLKKKDKYVYGAYSTLAFLSPEMAKIAKEARARALNKRQLKKLPWYKKVWMWLRK